MSYPKNSSLERDLVSRLRETSAGLARAMAATVVAAAPDARAEAADAVVDRLMGRRPARVLHLRTGVAGPGEGGAEDEFRAWSAARCALDRQNRGVCFEDVHLESGDMTAIDPRIWGPFVMRELPSILFWNYGPASLADCGCGADCAERVDLVLADGTADLADPAGGFAASGSAAYARAALEAWSGLRAYGDLAWERLEGFRSAVARLFNGPGRFSRLATVARAEFAFPDPWSAALAAAWFSARTAAACPSAAVSAAVSGIRSARFSFSDGASAGVAFAEEGTCSLEFPDGEVQEIDLPAQDDGALLARLVDAPLADPYYAEALKAAARGSSA